MRLVPGASLSTGSISFPVTLWFTTISLSLSIPWLVPPNTLGKVLVADPMRTLMCPKLQPCVRSRLIALCAELPTLVCMATLSATACPLGLSITPAITVVPSGMCRLKLGEKLANNLKKGTPRVTVIIPL